MCYILLWMNIYINLVLHWSLHFIFQYYYTSHIFFDSADHFFWGCYSTWSFFFWCCSIDECFLWLFCCVTLQNQSCFCITMVFVYSPSSVFAIICCNVNICYLHQDNIVLAYMFNAGPRYKANSTPINTVHHPINCQCSLPLS